MKPFFCFFGGKYRAAPHYPAPRFSRLVEPFAGGAGYATRYPSLDVTLFDADPVLAGVWAYLIRTPEDEIRRLPLLVGGEDVRGITSIPQEARWLIGFWLNKGTAAPCRTPSRWMRDGIRPNSFWGVAVRERIASQVGMIRHWRVFQAEYSQAPAATATWFVDPPYQQAGKSYVYGAKRIDFGALGEWCRSLRGQVVVCENQGADWLPFVPFRSTKATHGSGRVGKSHEVVWEGGQA
jgi:hypothetical protein